MFADLAQSDPFWFICERGFEALDRFAKRLGAEGESVVTHRYGKTRTDWHNARSPLSTEGKSEGPLKNRN
jgi:hypothetical protein